MVSCVHHIPGRARFKIEALRADQTLAEIIETRVSDIDGVHGVETNLHAASVIVHYCTQTAEITAVYDQICAHCPAATPRRRDPLPTRTRPAGVGDRGTPPASAALRDVVGKAVVNTFINRALEFGIAQIGPRLR